MTMRQLTFGNLPHTWRPWMVDAAGMAVVIGLSIGAYVLDIHPLHRARAEWSAHTAALAAQQYKVNELTGSLLSLQHQLEETRRKTAGGALQLEPVQRLNQRLSRLTDLAAANHLRIHDMEPGKSRPGPYYAVVEIRIACQGSSRGCSTFLDQLHQSMPDTVVAALQIAGKPGLSESPVDLAFTLYWFVAKPETPAK